MTDTPHSCHARNCNTPVPPRMFMCRKHWFMVPKPMQDAIWATYRPGQERTKDPSPEYLDAATAAVNAVADMERPRVEGTPA
jgi:hypothetical protein